VTSDWFTKQHASHDKLLDSSHQSLVQEQFDAIVVPTNRKVGQLDFCIGLARDTGIPLIVLCSKRVTKTEVKAAAAAENIVAYAIELPTGRTDLLKGITFQTSTNEELLAFTSGKTRDLSTKRNIGLIVAKMLGWERLMFLDDDIYDIDKQDVDALAAGLNDHNVSVIIPGEYPDNSVACHAYRLGRGRQGQFAGASGMGVRCDRDDLPFFPNIYNEDWFFFAEDAARRKLPNVGTSKQWKYNPYEDPKRAIKEEFGDLLAEGLYARLDRDRDIAGVTVAYWRKFVGSRERFLARVGRRLVLAGARYRLKRLTTRNVDAVAKGDEIRAAQVSIQAAQGQLSDITPELCQKFIDRWQEDLVTWRSYLGGLQPAQSVADALEQLGLDYEAAFPSNR
jgi:glycosyltransferase involved in cell wall biosynthesis